LGTLINSYGDLETTTVTTEQRLIDHYGNGDILMFTRGFNGPPGNYELLGETADEGVSWSPLKSLLDLWGNIGGGVNVQYFGDDNLLLIGRMNDEGVTVARAEPRASNIIMVVDRDSYEIINSFSWFHSSWGGDTGNGDATEVSIDVDGNITVDCIMGASTAGWFRIAIPSEAVSVLGSLSLMGVGR
jgi:hypothetical protein